jgi:hypothetical protein
MSDVLRPEPATSSDRQPLLSASAFDSDPAIVDHVAQILGPSINRLFSVTLALTGMATAQTDTRAANRLFGAVHEIDDAIRQLREDLTAELVAARAACDGEHASW